nr:Rpn family recombination-promoting nuclease/putative transposase [Ureibacillus xyleni]
MTFENPEIVGEYENDKESRLDLLVKTQANEHINVEIQFTNKFDMIKRTLYYWSKLYSQPLSSGVAYKQLNPIITINILNFDLFKESTHFHKTYHLHEDTEKTFLTDLMELHFVEIPKLLRDWKAQKLDPWNDVLARWLLLLSIVDHRKGTVYEDIYKELEVIAMKDKQLFDAFQQWQELSLSEKEYFAYLGRLKKIKDEESVIIEARLREEESREQGIEVGIEQGIRQVIVNLIKNGFSDEDISKLSNRSTEEVQAIRNECR